MIFDIKIEDFRNKTHLIAEGHMTKAPATFMNVHSRQKQKISYSLDGCHWCMRYDHSYALHINGGDNTKQTTITLNQKNQLLHLSQVNHNLSAQESGFLCNVVLKFFLRMSLSFSADLKKFSFYLYFKSMYFICDMVVMLLTKLLLPHCQLLPWLEV